MKTIRAAAAAAIAAVLLTTFGVASAAQATNPGTESGDHTEGCSVDWTASAVLDADLTNDDAEYPGLMQDRSGNTVDYTNGGYIHEVSPLLENPGLFEMNHYYYYDDARQAEIQAWRIPTATDYTILDAKVTFTLPAEVQATDVRFNAAPDVYSRIAGWGSTYARYDWSPRGTAVDNGDGTWTVDLGDLPRDTGTVYQFEVDFGATGFARTDRFVGSAQLTGTYAPGMNGGQCDLPEGPALPTATTDLLPCTAEFLGQTRWSVYDRDITERIKLNGTESSEEFGEINADGWGAGAEAWSEGSTRTFRLYAATKIDLENVTYVVDAVQGLSFAPVTVAPGVASPAGGALQGNGFTGAAEGVTVRASADGTRFTVHVDRMPAMSSLSFNVTGVLDGSRNTMVLDHRLIGTMPDCVQPPALVEPAAWSTETPTCEARTVTQTRAVTTTTYAWDRATLAWVGTPVTTTESRTASMATDGAEACAVTPPVTEPPAAELATTGGSAPWVAAIGAASLLVAGAGLLLIGRLRRA